MSSPRYGAGIAENKDSENYQALDVQASTPELGELEELEVFKMKCQSYGSPPEMENWCRPFWN